MNLALFATTAVSDTTLKMSSLEIADFVKSRHDDVKRSIERLVGKGAIVQPPTADEHSTDSMGRPRTTQVYTFSGPQGRLDSITVVAQLDPLFTAALVKRWDDLETGKAKPALPRQANAATIPQSTDTFAALFGVAKLIGCDTNAAAISANQGTIAVTGVDLLQLMGQTHLITQKQAIYYTPSELGKLCEPAIGPRAVNNALHAAGLQTHHLTHWEPTEQGKPYARITDTGKRHKSGGMVQQVKWIAEAAQHAGLTLKDAA